MIEKLSISIPESPSHGSLGLSFCSEVESFLSDLVLEREDRAYR